MAKIILGVALLFVAIATNAQSGEQPLTNRKVVRKINLEKHYTRIDSTITILNNGNTAKSRVALYPDPNIQEHLSTFLVYVNGKSLWLDPNTWEVQLPTAIEKDETVDLTINEIYIHATGPFPVKIKQTMDQSMRYNGNLHHYSPYKTRRSQITVTTPSPKIHSFFPNADARHSSKTVTYDMFKDLPALHKEAMDYHYQANIPYISTHYLLRQIEVSHWGNIAVRDNADVWHLGAELDGTFSRVQYQQDGGDDSTNSHWVPKLTAKLPVSATNVFYRDAIGNISTSRLRQHKDRVEVELRPRTPLFGGWKSDYTLGFNLPSEKALFFNKDDPSRFTLKMKAIDELYKDQVIDQVEIQIILPEGAKDIQVVIPAGYDRAHDEVLFTYLDMYTGRPVLKLRAEGLAGKSLDQNLQVTYTFSRSAIIREPLMTIVFFLMFFVFVMFLVRLDLTIGDDASSDVKARIAAAYMMAQEANKKRISCQAAYEKALNRYKETKDLAILSASQKQLKNETNNFKRVVNDVIVEHKEVLNDKLDQIAVLGNSYNEAIQKGHAGISKVREIDGKINSLVEI